MTPRRRQWHPTPVLLPGKSHGWRSLEGCSPWGRWGSDTTERLPFHFSLSCIGEGNGNPLQCSCLENPRDGGTWRAAVYGVTQSWTRLKHLSSSSSMTPQRLWWSHLFVVQSLSRVWLFVTRWTAAHQASLSVTISQSLCKLLSIELVTPSSHLVLCHLLTLLPSIRQHLGVFHRTPRDISCKCCFSNISFFCHILEKFLLNMVCQGIKK